MGGMGWQGGGRGQTSPTWGDPNGQERVGRAFLSLHPLSNPSAFPFSTRIPSDPGFPFGKASQKGVFGRRERMAPAPPSASEAHAHVVVPTRFLWRYGGKQVRPWTPRTSPVPSPATCADPSSTHGASFQVHLCGSFTRWVETIPMSPLETHPGVFVVVVNLPPGCAARRRRRRRNIDAELTPRRNTRVRPGTINTSSSWMVNGGTTRAKPSCRIRSETSTTGCSSEGQKTPGENTQADALETGKKTIEGRNEAGAKGRRGKEDLLT